MQKQITIVTAESCTGGMLAAALTHKPGASKIFDRGFITYSNESKNELLEVPKEALDKYGAVSGITAQVMAQGALAKSRAGVSVSITGIAGPDGGSVEKPVGLVYIGYAVRDEMSGSVEHHFSGTRREIQVQAATMAIKTIIGLLEPPA